MCVFRERERTAKRAAYKKAFFGVYTHGEDKQHIVVVVVAVVVVQYQTTTPVATVSLFGVAHLIKNGT